MRTRSPKQSEVGDELHRTPALVTCDLDWATGLILCVRTAISTLGSGPLHPSRVRLPARDPRKVATMVTRPLLAALGNLDSPGRYLHWSIFIVSEANLVLIAVMVVIFGAALLDPLPRPHPRTSVGASGGLLRR